MCRSPPVLPPCTRELPMRDTGRRRRGPVVAVALPMLLLTGAPLAPAVRRAQVVRRPPADTAAEAPWRPKVRAFAEAHLQHTAWGPAHGRRDYETTLALAKAERLTVDDDALYAAAYLHDMGGIPPYALPGVDHGDRSIQLVDSVLRDAGFPMEKSPLVKEIIDHHQYYRPPDTLRIAALFRDADILDFMGAIDVARIISLTTRERLAPDLNHAVQVIRKQMTDMPALLQSATARKEGQRRVAEMRAFLDALALESDSLSDL